MTFYKSKNGKPRYQARSGQYSEYIKKRRESLVRQGKASPWLPLRTLDDAIERAGL